jgi:hypothetical protein
VGRRYRAVVVLGSRKKLCTDWDGFNTESLVSAGLTNAVLPPPTDDEIEEANRRLFPSSFQKDREEGKS